MLSFKQSHNGRKTGQSYSLTGVALSGYVHALTKNTPVSFGEGARSCAERCGSCFLSQGFIREEQ